MRISQLSQLLRHLCPLWLMVCQCLASDGGGKAGAFLRVGLGPRAKGMGDAYTAIAENAYAPYYNAGGLGFLDHKEIGASYSLMSFDRTATYAGFVRNLPPTAGFGLGILQSGFKDSEVRDADGLVTGEKLRDVQYTAMMGFSIRFSDKLALGIVPKLVYSRVYDVSASSVGIDLGGLYKYSPNLSFGLAVHDLFLALTYKRDASGAGQEETTDRLPTIVKWGSAYQWDRSGAITSVLIAHDLEWSHEAGMIQHVGIEANVIHKFDIRIGSDHGDFTTGFSFPFVVKEKHFRLDYAFILDRRQGIGTGTQDLAISFIF